MDMPLQVIHPDQRLIQPKRQRLRVRNPHQQRPRQPRPLRHSNRIQILKPNARTAHRLTHHRHDVAQMLARGQLRNHAAVVRMQVHLRGNNVRQRLRTTAHHCRRRLIARALDAQNQPAQPCARIVTHLFIIGDSDGRASEPRVFEPQL